MSTIDLWECSRCHGHYGKERTGTLLTLQKKALPYGMQGYDPGIRQDYLCEACTAALSTFIDDYRAAREYKHE